MYKKIQLKYYYGPADQQKVVKAVLRNMGVPGHSASVYERTHDTGYPGLITQNTVVELCLEQMLSIKVGEALINLGFYER